MRAPAESLRADLTHRPRQNALQAYPVHAPDWNSSQGPRQVSFRLRVYH